METLGSFSLTLFLLPEEKQNKNIPCSTHCTLSLSHVRARTHVCVCVCVDERLGPEDNRLSHFSARMLPSPIHRHDERGRFGDLSEAA